MLTSQRKEYILKVLREQGQVVAKAISQETADQNAATVRTSRASLAQADTRWCSRFFPAAVSNEQ